MDAVQPTSGPRNVVLFLGDGMGISTITAARIHAGQKQGLPGEAYSLAFEKLPNVALIKTYNTDLQVPDSAGTMSALVTGVKTRAGVLSIPPSVNRGNCPEALKAPLPTLLEEAEALGLRTGLVTTARLTHATPAANYAHSADRNWEDDTTMPVPATGAGCRDIARQFVEFGGGDGVDVALGGGRANFFPEDTMDPEYAKPLGRRKDNRDLVAEWVAAGADRRYAWDRATFEAALATAEPGSTQLLGLFEPSHMQYDADRDTAAEPALAELAIAALDLLSSGNQDGYYLVVEGGRIDHAHHQGNAYRALEDTLAFDAAVAAVLERVDLEDTLVLVTADHSHTLTISGYPVRGNPILGKVRIPTGALLCGAD
ncbi:MAG: alkaline phosphatase, partial [Pseudomonadota bacterium]